MVARTKLATALLLIGWLLKLVFALVAVLLPLFGVWIASSLAAHLDGPLWASLVAGGLCFPLLPLAWDLFATWRSRRSGRVRPRVLTHFDRLLLRTLIINLVFVGSLLAIFPSRVFEALSTRGDWMLPRDAPWAERARELLFEGAERMAWLHEATHDNAYEDLIDPSLTQTKDGEAPKAGEVPRFVWPTEPTDPTEPSKPAVSPSDLYRTDAWPFAPTLHPAVVSLPPASETSIEAVAQYIVAQEPDPVQRVKALHDYVADRVAYDVPAYLAHEYPPQDAESVFRRRTAVCAGSAMLLAELGRAAGIEIIVVVGNGRNEEGLFDGMGHAWNAIKLDDRWYLADPTWDAGSVSGDTFTKHYESSYFMTPPDVFVATHMPEDPKWQLLDQPLALGDFIRQPQLRPNFAALGFRLVDPQRARLSLHRNESLTLTFENPHAFRLSGDVRSIEGLDPDPLNTNFCDTDESGTRMQCRFPELGHREIVLFGPEGVYLGQIYVDVE